MQIDIHKSLDDSALMVFEVKNASLEDEARSKLQEAVTAVVQRFLKKCESKGGKKELQGFLPKNIDEFKIVWDKNGPNIEVKNKKGETKSIKIEGDELQEAIRPTEQPHGEIILNPDDFRKKPQFAISEKVRILPIRAKGIEIPKWVEKLRTTGDFGELIARFIARVFIFTKIIDTSVQYQLDKDFIGLDPKEVRSKFVNFLEKRDTWLDTLKLECPEISNYFEDGELRDRFEQALLVTANHKLQERGFPTIRDYELDQFEREVTVRKLAFEKNPQIIKAALAKIEPTEMPYEQLAKIDVTESNKKALADVWSNVLTKLHAQRGVVQNAAKFLYAIEKLPQEIKKELSQNVKNVIEDSELIKKLNKDIIKANAFYATPIKLDDKDLDEKQKVYSFVIKEELDRMLANATYGYGADKICKMLAGATSEKKPDNLPSHEKFSNHVYEGFSDRQKKLFPKEYLEELFFDALEQKAQELYKLTDTQIKNLREYRKHISKQVSAVIRLTAELATKDAMASKTLTKELKEVLTHKGSSLITVVNSNCPDYIKKDAIRACRQLKSAVDSITVTGDKESVKDVFTEFEKSVSNKNLLKEDALPLSWQAAVFLDEKNIPKDFTHPTGLTADEAKDLLTISKFLSAPIKLTKVQKQELMAVLERLNTVPDFSKKLEQFAATRRTERLTDLVPSLFKRFVSRYDRPIYRLPVGISESSKTLVAGFIKMMQKYKSISVTLDKAEALIAKANQEINPAERLTYRELGSISSLARNLKLEDRDAAEPPLAILDRLGFKEADYPEKVKQCNSESNRSLTIVEDLTKLLAPEFAGYYQDGDILGFAGEKKSLWTGRPLEAEEDMVRRIADYGLTHGIKVYHQGGDLYASQVYSKHEADKIKFYEVAISDAWRITVEPLIHPACKEAVKATGKDANTMYRGIESRLHSEIKTHFRHIRNDDRRRIEAGLADYQGLVNFLGGVSGQNVEGHIAPHEQDFQAIYKQFTEGKDLYDTQICSEFVSKSTLVAFMQLNKDMTAKIKTTDMYTDLKKRMPDIDDKDVHDYVNGVRHFGHDKKVTLEAEKKLRKILKGEGFTEKEIELVIRVGNEEIFDLPYDKKERMHAIHPGRMVTLLEKKGCASKIPHPDLFKKFIAVPGEGV